MNNQKQQKQCLDEKITELETVVGNLKAELAKKEEEKKKVGRTMTVCMLM